MVVEVIPIEAPLAFIVGVQVSPVADRTRTEMSAGTEIDIVMSGQLYVPEQSLLQLEIPRAIRKKTAMMLICDSMSQK